MTAYSKLKEIILEQISINIDNYHESEFDRKGFITLNWKEMTRDQRSKIELLSIKNGWQLVDYGAWAKWLKR